ncbi:hypothetical protein QNI16_11640 [Cytophagaceae bacterium YF14B1]|uniref:GyrI-like domain-containing protein n=1 Tax=Xanthocytophaga flava TaxID=3048013 RepID=A0AAE3U5T6_9BACT|nr:hypothetical protein [Xanthocytophaga flavus]MDJ1481139.1 hypothetical protein [Xanthocytophaga flavus]
MTRKLGIIIVVALLVGSIAFSIMGGFSKPEISTAQAPEYIVAGKLFKGGATSDTLMTIFSEIKDLHTTQKLPGTLAAVYYSIPEEAKGKLEVWVGVLVSDTTIVLPEGYLFRKFPSSNVIRAEIKAHYMVAPAPDKVKAQLYEFATEQKVKPGRYVIEKYHNEQDITMEIPVTKL